MKKAAIFSAFTAMNVAAAPPHADTPLPEGWHRESAPGTIPGAGTYSVALPPEMQKVPVTGIDSYVAEYRSPGLTLLFDFGAQGGSTRLTCRGRSRCTIGPLDVHGGRASRLRYFRADPDGGLPYRAAYEVRFAPRARRISLIVGAECASARACDLADRIVKMIEILPPR